MFSAIFSGNLSQVKSFIDNGGDIETATFGGETLLLHSIFFERTEIAMFLLENGADINHQDGWERTALYWAIMRRNQELTNILIERNANLIPNSDSSKRMRPISLTYIAAGQCISDPRQTWISAETHSEFLPYIEKYLSIKKEILDQEEFDYPIKILFYRSNSEVWRRVSSLSGRYFFQGMATCVPNTRHIVVNYDAWISLPEITKETHFFHELGHCDLDRVHEPKTAKSLMSIFYLQQLSLKGVDIHKDPVLKQKVYEEFFSPQRDDSFRRRYIEGQVYPSGLKNNDDRACPVKTRLYLDDTKSD